MKEYRLSRGWSIFMYLMTSIFFIAFSAILLLPILSDGHSLFFWLYIPIIGLLLASFIIIILDTAKGKFVIDHNKVYSKTTFRKRELYFEEIKGFRTTPKYIIIIPKNNDRKSIKISHYFGNSKEIVHWLSMHYPDMDIIDANEQQQSILNNEDYGYTVEERTEKLKQAKKIAKLTNGIGIIIAVWVFVMGRPYDFSIFALILMPVFSIVILKKFDGLIRIGQEKRSLYPTIVWTFIYPCLALFLRTLADFEIFQYKNVWLPCVLLTITFLSALLIRNKEFKFNRAKNYLTICSITLFLFAHSFGAIIALNCEYDSSQPKVYHSSVLNKRINKGKSTSYYLKLTPWGPQKEAEEIEVSDKFYNKIENNQAIDVLLKKGNFNIPWYIVTSE